MYILIPMYVVVYRATYVVIMLDVPFFYTLHAIPLKPYTSIPGRSMPPRNNTLMPDTNCRFAVSHPMWLPT